MRLVPSLHLSYPDLRAVRIALAAGAVSGLVVLGACQENSDKGITAPSAPRNATTLSVGFAHAKHVILCVSATSPAGTYTFTNTGENDPSASLPGYGFHDVPAPPGGGLWWDQGDGGTGTTVFAASPDLLSNGSCITVLDRTAGDLAFQNNTQLNDSWASVNMTNTATPGGATFDHVECVLDNGVLAPEPANCAPDGFGNTSNPIRAFANFEHGDSVIFSFTAPPPPPPGCVLPYPTANTTAFPLASTTFNEYTDLTAFGREANELRLWYTDEHAMTLGVDSITVKNPTNVLNYLLVSKLLTDPGSASPVSVGFTALTGDLRGTDPAGRPLTPSIFVTDLTANGPTSAVGDWQTGNGVPVFPNAVYGSWKAAKVFLDKTKTPNTRTITPDADPAKNHKNVGAGGVNPPASVQDLGYSTEVVWNFNAIPGFDVTHNYRIQFMVHDGDQNKTGGDVGEACMFVGPAYSTSFVQIAQ
jgi:hypothetical protein